MNNPIKCVLIIGKTVIMIQAKIQFNMVVKDTVGGCTIYGMYSQVIGPKVITKTLTYTIRQIKMNN